MSRLHLLIAALASVVLIAACTSGNTTGATNVTSTSATLNATASCDGTGSQTCGWYFEYSTDPSFPSGSTTNTPTQRAPAGSSTGSAKVTGLTSSTTYYYKLCGPLTASQPNNISCVGPDGQTSSSDKFMTAASSGVGTCPTPPPGASATFDGNAFNREGWDTFTKNAPTGSWATGQDGQVVYTGDQGLQWTEYPDGWPSTFSAGKEGYQPSTVLSVHDGVLDFYLHNDASGNPVGANPSPLPGGNGYTTYGAYSLCEKMVPSDSHKLDDFKQAILLWPQADSNGPAAESDYPEGNLNATSMGAFAHNTGGQDSFSTGTIDTGQWHVYTQTWGPGFRKYFLDGKLIGTSTSNVWSQQERWQLQLEPMGTNTGATGHVYVSWAWIGGTSTSPPPPASSPPPPPPSPPAAPTGLSLSGQSQTTLTLNWTASPGASSYHTSLNGVAAGDTTSTSKTFTGLACGTSYVLGTQAFNSAGASSTATATGTTSACPTGGGRIQHVVWIWMENQDYSNIYGPQPYETSVANQFGLAENYYAIGHFSADNYITGTSGAAWNSCLGGDGSPGSCPQSQDNIFHQLGSGQAVNLIDPGNTDVNHQPVEYYTDLGCSGPGSCPFEQSLPSSFTSTTFNPELTFITPNKTDDGHDSSASTADSWLQGEVPKIMATPQYQAGTMAIFIVFDESNVNDTEGATSPPNNHVYVSVISPNTSAVKDTTQYTHCSLLRTVEDIFGQTPLGCASSANSMVGKFGF